MSHQERSIGIDLGTTNSVVAVIENENPRIIESAEGQSKTPSIVAFMENGEVVVGEIARRQAATQPHRTISSAKRLLGRYKSELEEEGEDYPFEVGEDEEGRATIVIGDQAYSPEQISALILQKLKTAAEEALGEPATKAIVTVPAYFDDVQRHATLEAARIAGLEVLRLINEPTAAAMAYGLGKDAQETVAIYDFGGGTFDFSVLEIDDNTFEVLTSTGNSRLGGDDLDMALVDYVAEKFLERHNLDLRNDLLTLRRLKDEMERVKCELSSSTQSMISLPFIAYADGNPLHLEEKISREAVEEIIEPFVKESIRCCREALKEARIKRENITKVILVGGTTRIPLVQELVEEYFGIQPFKGVNPDEIVAVGAAMQAAVLAGELQEVVLLDVTPHTLSIETRGNSKSVLIEKNATIPIKVAKTFTTTENDQSFVNVHLLQGDSEKASECRSLGRFTLSGIPEAEAGTPRIQVEIFVNADGVVEVSATETSTGREQKLSTSLTYLNAEERRKRQGLSGKRKRRKRKSRIEKEKRRILDATPAPSSASSDAGEGGAPEENMDFAEVGTDAPAASGKRAKARRPTPRNSDSSGAQSGSAPRAAACAEELLDEMAGEAEREETRAAAAATAVADEEIRRAGKPDRDRDGEDEPGLPDDVEAPAALRAMLELLAMSRSDEEAVGVYEQTRKDFLDYCRRHEAEPTIQEWKIKFLIYLREPEQAREALAKMRRAMPERKERQFELYGLLCRNFPHYAAARRDRAELACEIGDMGIAMIDLEFVARREDSDTEVFDRLSGIYERFLEENPDATVQFKLVKAYLRRGELDGAIGLLQQLVQNPSYADRATRVLGLCFWQKGLRYLALQKFKTLAPDEELKDILYRLALDMEANDELLHAKYALERIYEIDINFRDTAEKLKKIGYRVDLMKDERYGAVGASSGEAREGERTLIGERFEILGEINRGSMGIVYRSFDRHLDEVVAIKVLNDFLCNDPQAIERFKQEARSARKLAHPNIVRIHDFLDLDRKKVISMEYIEGEDMKTILSRNATFTEDMIFYYLRHICVAMGYAHGLGVIHRDIKPANIMIDDRNQVKVTDFGIAKVLDAAVTNNGTMVMGTPLYMAPEQIKGEKIDQRVDIYALGVMLYELISGRPPFQEGRIEYQHLHKAVPELTMSISKPLKKIIFKCLEKKPENRYQSIDEILKDLPS